MTALLYFIKKAVDKGKSEAVAQNLSINLGRLLGEIILLFGNIDLS
jgi:hypothetical protein